MSVESKNFEAYPSYWTWQLLECNLPEEEKSWKNFGQVERLDWYGMVASLAVGRLGPGHIVAFYPVFFQVPTLERWRNWYEFIPSIASNISILIQINR